MHHLTLALVGERTNKSAKFVLLFLLAIVSYSGVAQTITTVAGNGIGGFYGDGGQAVAAQTDYPYSVSVDAAGGIYIADFYNNRIRKVNTSGIMVTIAGKGFDIGSQKFGDNGPAVNANLYHPSGASVDDSGNVYIADALANRVRKINHGGIISTIAGFGTAGYGGDGDLATKAKLNGPSCVAIDAFGNLYIADRYNHCVRKISASGVITTVAGNGKQGFSGDGEDATKAKLNEPRSVCLDPTGNLYIADYGNNCVRKVSVAGIITTIAGKGGKEGFSGDGGPARISQLNGPVGIVADQAGILYIADQNNNRIRRISTDGIISTFAGKGTRGYSGDAGEATDAQLNAPISVSVDTYGNVYIADFGNYRIRKVATHLYNNNVNLTGTLLFCDSLKPMANVKVNIGYGKNEVVASTVTNIFGSFAFASLAPGENYHFKIEAVDTTIKLPSMCKISLSDKNGTILKTLTGSTNGNFYFEVLKADTSALLEHMKVDDSQLKLEITRYLLNDQKAPMAHMIVSAFGKDGKLLQESFTDTHGKFTLTDMPLDKAYYIQVDKLSDQLSTQKPVYLADEKSTAIAELNTKNDYRYEVRVGDAKNMGGVYLDDPWLRALRLKNEEIKITENIYFDYQKWDVLPAAARILDKVILVMKHDLSINIELDAYTDSRGDDEFNIRLSQKRANSVMAYMALNGIAANRMIGKGLGKANPLINCGDPNVHCSDAEYAVNRRIEFKIKRVTATH